MLSQPDFFASYTPKSMILVNDSLVFSDKHFTLNNPQFLNQPLIEYVSYQLNQNGLLSIKTKFLNPVTFKQEQEPIEIRCNIGKGALFYSSRAS